MADLSELTPELPPQATGNTLPGAAAAAGMNDVAAAPTAADVLLDANYGDKGGQQYRDLRAAGQPPPAPAPAAPPPGAGGSIGGIGNLLGATIAGAATQDPYAGMKIAQQQTQIAAQQQAMKLEAQRQAQAMAVTDADFISKLKDQPLPMRTAIIQSYAAKQGRQLDPAEASYIANIDPTLLQHVSERAKQGDPMAIAQMNDLFSGDWVKMQNSKEEMRKTSAEADKLIAETELIKQKTAGVDSESVNAAIEVAKNVRTLQKPPTPNDIKVLDAGGLEAYQVPIPGKAGEMMWSTRPKKGGAGTISADTLRANEAKEVGLEAKSREDATQTATTRTMKEKAPKVRALADETLATMDKIMQGPIASRWQDFWAGKIGEDNPEFVEFKTNADLLTSLLANMHNGARSSEYISQKFDRMIGAGKQSANNMRAALRAIKKYSNMVENSHENDEVNISKVESELNAPVKVNSPAERDALPKGTKYISPDGKVRVRG